MFTGIVQAMLPVLALKPKPFGARLVVDRQQYTDRQLAQNDSICISGVCLTLVHVDEQSLAFDVVAETLAKTTLSRLRPGDPVNLEPSVTPSTPLGGHFVQGHVEGVGTVVEVQSEKDYRIKVDPPDELLPTIVAKGSIALEGVSLTVAAAGPSDFEVALIPTTLQLTTLGGVTPGTRLNLETDIISRTVVHAVRQITSAGGWRG